MHRRDFLKAGAAAAACSFLPWNVMASDKAMVVVHEIVGAPAGAVERLFSSLGGLGSLIPKDVDISHASVLVKPNLCLPHPAGMATTTSPELVGAICSYLVRQKVKRIMVMDHTLQKAGNFEGHDMLEVGDNRKGVKVILANEQRYYRPVEVNGKVLKKTEVLKTLDGVDLVINAATAKHHSATQVSLAIKNLMGVIWNRSEFHIKMDLHQAIGDLAAAVRPGLNIIDAGRVLLDNGPTGPGPVTQDNRIFASTDILALDSVVAARYDFGGKSRTANEIPHLRAAYENGVGEIDIKKIELRKVKV